MGFAIPADASPSGTGRSAIPKAQSQIDSIYRRQALRCARQGNRKNSGYGRHKQQQSRRNHGRRQATPFRYRQSNPTGMGRRRSFRFGGLSLRQKAQTRQLRGTDGGAADRTGQGAILAAGQRRAGDPGVRGTRRRRQGRLDRRDTGLHEPAIGSHRGTTSAMSITSRQPGKWCCTTALGTTAPA